MVASRPGAWSTRLGNALIKHPRGQDTRFEEAASQGKLQADKAGQAAKSCGQSLYSVASDRGKIQGP